MSLASTMLRCPSRYTPQTIGNRREGAGRDLGSGWHQLASLHRVCRVGEVPPDDAVGVRRRERLGPLRNLGVVHRVKAVVAGRAAVRVERARQLGGGRVADVEQVTLTPAVEILPGAVDRGSWLGETLSAEPKIIPGPSLGRDSTAQRVDSRIPAVNR